MRTVTSADFSFLPNEDRLTALANIGQLRPTMQEEGLIDAPEKRAEKEGKENFLFVKKLGINPQVGFVPIKVPVKNLALAATK